MKQFVRYLYQYREEKKTRNVGFVKAERQGNECLVHIYGKGLETSGEMTVTVFCERQGQWSNVFQDTLEQINTAIHCVLKLALKDIECMENFEKTGEIILQSKQGHRYVATWGEKERQMEVMADEYVEPSNIQYEKISREDIVRLPRQEWKLANNSFLLHGFYNYHHLLYIKEGEKTWIGVPGIYHEKESVVAKSFGFPRFHRITDKELELTEEETNRYEDFGYWCRAV